MRGATYDDAENLLRIHIHVLYLAYDEEGIDIIQNIIRKWNVNTRSIVCANTWSFSRDIHPLIRFFECAAKDIPKSGLQCLQYIRLYTGVYRINDKTDTYRTLLESIGRLRCQCTVVAEKLPATLQGVAWGNIRGLFAGPMDGSITHLGQYLIPMVEGSRIYQLGAYDKGTLKYPVDNVTIATQIERDPFDPNHTTKQLMADMAAYGRVHRGRVYAYYSACVLLVTACKTHNFSDKLLVRHMTSFFGPDDWSTLAIHKKPKWATEAVRRYRAYIKSVNDAKEIADTHRYLQKRQRKLRKELKALPDQISKAERNVQAQKKVAQKDRNELEKFCQTLRIDAYDRVMGPKRQRLSKK